MRVGDGKQGINKCWPYAIPNFLDHYAHYYSFMLHTVIIIPLFL